MSKLLFSNNAKTVLASPISASDTTLLVAAGAGSLFPSPVDGTSFRATLSDALNVVREIVNVTVRAGDTMTVQRGQENTVATSWGAGSRFELLATADGLNGFVQWQDLGIPTKMIDLGAGGGPKAISLGDLPVGAPTVMLALTASDPTTISDITGATRAVSVILSVLSGSDDISIPLDTAPFYLSDIYGDVGWPGFPLSTISLLYNPLNDVFKWVEQARTQRTS